MLSILGKVALLLIASAGGTTLASGKPIVQIHNPSPLLSLDFAVRLNLTLGGSKIADLDRARAASKFGGLLGRRDGSISATNTGVTYVVDVGVGEPATTYSLVVDTGSSNTWIGKMIFFNFATSLADGYEQAPIRSIHRRVPA